MLYLKLVWMYVIAMFTALFIYPSLHEMGHFLAALMVGADVVEISVFPVPYICVFVDPQNSLGQAVIGMCGMLFPMLCMLFQPKRFLCSIAISTLSLINALAWMLSCMALVANRLGFGWENEDIITVVQCVEGAETIVFFFCLIALTISVYVPIKEKNIYRIISFF